MGRTRQTADLVGGSGQLSVNATNDTLHIGTGVTIFGNSGIVSATSLFISGDSVFGGAAPVGVASAGTIVSAGATLLNFIGSGNVLTANGDTVDISIAGGGGGSSTLAGLTDVTISNLQTNEILKYNGSAWVNDTDATGGGGGGSITMAIGVRVGTAVTFAFSGSSFNVLNRSGGNTVINI